jgi:novobiocin biosynthesis protein NovU/D-mycarose 3-C-methyltransferase
MYKLHTICRACGFESLLPVVDLGIQPLANDFRTANEDHSGFAPLKVLFCPRCTLAQLSVVVDPKILYKNYPYVTSTSQTMLDHFHSLYRDLRNLKEGTMGDVLEIGSNDGTLLEFLGMHGGVRWTMGVDPALNLTELSSRKGVPTVCSLWNEKCANHLAETRKYDTIIARHVFCHVDDWHEFIRALEIVSHKDTLVAIEVPYAKDLLEHRAFDTIYHEHLSYMTCRAMEALLKDTSFCLSDVVHYPVHGGAILMILRKREGTIAWLGKKEIVSLEDWKQLSGEANSRSINLLNMVDSARHLDRRVCGFGASAKSTVWTRLCGFDKSDLAFICDCTPQKQGKLSPGTDIPIVDEGALLREMPDYAIIFAWNFAEEIIARNQLYLKNGGHFVVPVPEMKVVGNQ